LGKVQLLARKACRVCGNHTAVALQHLPTMVLHKHRKAFVAFQINSSLNWSLELCKKALSVDSVVRFVPQLGQVVIHLSEWLVQSV
jgi:hypothetical protein